MARQLFERLSSILDESSTEQIRLTLRNIRGIDYNWWATILSFVFFIFVATTLFGVIKNSMDQIWSIGLNEKLGILFNLKLRGRSMVIILLAGILFFVGLLTDSIRLLSALISIRPLLPSERLSIHPEPIALCDYCNHLVCRSI